MNLQDLETAVRMKLNMAIVIFNDSSYNLIKWKSMKKFGTSYGVDFTNPDFIKVADGFGAVGLRLQSMDDFEPMLRDALTKEVPVIIDVPIDYSENELIYKLYEGRASSPVIASRRRSNLEFMLCILMIRRRRDNIRIRIAQTAPHNNTRR